MNFTLEERERRAYVTNDPVQFALAEALDLNDEAIDEERHEAEWAKTELEDQKSRADYLEAELGNLRKENARLAAQISAIETVLAS